MNIALIHDHLAQDGGAEKVLRAFCEIWPHAPIYVVVHNPKNANVFFSDKDVRTSFIQRLPFGVRKYQWYFPLMPAAVEGFDLSEYDVVLSTSSSFAKGVITRPASLHISYCHTPTRFLWSDTHSYVEELSTNRIVKKVLPFFLSHLRIWDRIASERPDMMIANSKTVARRIEKYYHRQAEVLYPPVDLSVFSPLPKEDVLDFFLAGGRVVPYKRFDLIIEAFNKTGKKLVIFGDGPARKDLQKRARDNITFCGRVQEKQLAHLYAVCSAFISPQEEDFGITMLEAMASGRPVIAYRKGGAEEIVQHGKTGILMDFQSWEDIANVVMDFDKDAWDSFAIRAHALTFHNEEFKKKIRDVVETAYNTFIHKKI